MNPSPPNYFIADFDAWQTAVKPQGLLKAHGLHENRQIMPALFVSGCIPSHRFYR